jgi:gamma-glutamyltranspeptidase/glutathione hydrolase
MLDTMSTPFSTNTAAVATHHPLAADTARQILLAGGNAVDAAVASMITLCVVLPGSVGLGGYGGSMVLYSAKTRKTIALDFDSRCPLAYRDELFADDWTGKSNFGYLAVTVPAVIAGLAMALREFGTKSWTEVSSRAADLAENGFPMDSESRRQLEKWQAGADPASLRAHFPGGAIPAIGKPWVQKDLARMIRRLSDEGPEAFYRGEIPARIVKQIRDHGGILNEDDFASYRPRIVEPLQVAYRGHQLFTPPPPSGGISMLELMKTLEQFDLAAMERWSAPYLHLVAEASKLCWEDRRRCLGDPDFVTMPLQELLSDASAATRAAKLRKPEVRRNPRAGDSAAHTSNVSVVDREGNLVSLTATQGFQFGSRVVIDGLGLVMGHGMSRFDFFPADHPNRPAPGKRMHHNMSPTIVLKHDRPFAAVGLPGGTKIITVTAQLLVNLIDFDCSAAQTVHAPRVHSDGDEPIAVSGSLPDPVAGELVKMGHDIVRGQSIGGPPNEVAGPANAVLIDDTGRVSAASSAALDAASVL